MAIINRSISTVENRRVQVARELDRTLDRQQRLHGFPDAERLLFYLAAAFGEGRRHGQSTEQIAATAANFFSGLSQSQGNRS